MGPSASLERAVSYLQRHPYEEGAREDAPRTCNGARHTMQRCDAALLRFDRGTYTDTVRCAAHAAPACARGGRVGQAMRAEGWALEITKLARTRRRRGPPRRWVLRACCGAAVACGGRGVLRRRGGGGAARLLLRGEVVGQVHCVLDLRLLVLALREDLHHLAVVVAQLRDALLLLDLRGREGTRAVRRAQGDARRGDSRVRQQGACVGISRRVCRGCRPARCMSVSPAVAGARRRAQTRRAGARRGPP